MARLAVRCALAVAVLVVTALALASHARAQSPSLLGSLYTEAEQCKAGKLGNPPCLRSNVKEENVVLQDREKTKPRACLIVPTMPVTGIEDPQTLSVAHVRNIFELGWGWRDTCFKNAPAPGKGKAEPDDWAGMAINSEAVRSQNQLHVHLSCLAPAVRTLVWSASPGFHANDWKATVVINHHTWHARKLTSLQQAQSPFALVQSQASKNKKDDNYIGWHSLVVIGTKTGAFFLLDGYRENGHNAVGEAMLDETCTH
jgi:CDP-diacylglycerol pyrophosphatase